MSTASSMFNISCLTIFLKLVFAPSAKEWKKHHAGFHFPSLYNFIVDMFEDPEGDEAKKTNKELLKWWNRYVSVQCPGSLLIWLHSLA